MDTLFGLPLDLSIGSAIIVYGFASIGVGMVTYAAMTWAGRAWETVAGWRAADQRERERAARY